MHTSILKRAGAIVLSAAVLCTAAISGTFLGKNSTTLMNVEAASVDYPPQLMNLSLYDNSKNLASSGSADKSSCIYQAADGSQNEQWRIDYCGSDSNGSYYKIVNQVSGRILTPYGYSVTDGTDVVIYGNENDHSQYWYILPVSQDVYGNDLYYKIVNYSNTNLALTAAGSSATLSAYTGANTQKWLLNCAGLQGFAGYCYDDNCGNIKAGDIGGVLGETVEVSTFSELSTYAASSKPYTIVITGDISVSDSTFVKDSSGDYYCTEGRVYVSDNTTIIGSYDHHTLYNVAFCTKRNSGEGNNVILKNMELQHSADANGNDNIIVYFSEGENLWVDHVTFVGHSTIGSSPTYGTSDKDKFLACCYNADYCTVSDCTFGYHEYGVILGYPDDSAASAAYIDYPNMTLLGNDFGTYTRGPGLMRWGYYHSLNNYVHDFSMAYTVSSACKIYAECCAYEGNGQYTANVICDWNDMVYNGYYTETGSIFSNCDRTDQTKLGSLSSYPGNSEPCSWRPITNYNYTALTAENAKTYCVNYSGAQSSKSNVNYTNFAAAGVQSVGYMSGVESNWSTADTGSGSTGDTGSTGVTRTVAYPPTNTFYQITNANSGLSLNIADGSTKSGANVQQWSADAANPTSYDTFRFVASDEDGYYYIQSQVGDKTLVLDLTGGKTTDGTNLEIYTYKDGSANQKFQILDNGDGTYRIVPKASNSIYIEVENGSWDYGANVQFYSDTGANCQDWILTEVDFSGETMDTSVNYLFQNVNSELYMEVADANDADGANIQQWSLNGTMEYNAAEWSSWKLKFATGDLYYIVSNLSEKRYLSIDADNAVLKAFDSSNTTPYMVRFLKNPDGSYVIQTRASIDKTGSVNRYDKCLEVSGASLDLGGNIQQWSHNGYTCQSWYLTTFETAVVTTTEDPVVTTEEVTTTKEVTTTAPEITRTVAYPPTNTFYQITNANSGLSLNIADGSEKSGANVQQWSADAANPTSYDTFRFVASDEDGYYYIQSQVGDKTLVLDLTGGKTTNGTNLEIYTYKDGSANQKFQILDNGNGTYRIVPKASNSIYIEVENGSWDYGANVQFYSDTGANCQDWILTEVDFSGETMNTNVNYLFQNVNSGLYMEVADANDADGANIQQWSLNGTMEYNAAEWSSWKLKSATGDLYYIVSNLSEKRYLSIDEDNAVLKAFDSSNTTPYMVRFLKNPDGSYVIQTRASIDKTGSVNRYDKCLEVSGASLDLGGNIQQWSHNGYTCQSWYLTTFNDSIPEVTFDESDLITGLGDVTLDGEIDLSDVIYLMKMLTYDVTYDASAAAAADFDEDGSLTIQDAIALLQFELNMDA